jgi:subtilisin family serine protease
MTIRQLIVVRADDFPFLGKRYGIGDAAEREKLFTQAAATLSGLLGGFKRFRILEIPSLNWKIQLAQQPDREPGLDRLVFSIGLPNRETADDFRKAAEDAINSGDATKHIYGVGADISLAESEYFCPANVDQLLFGDRAGAAALTRSGILQQGGLTGSGVNVVVIDEGFDGTKVRHFGGGLINCLGVGVQAGGTTRGHGMMMVRNIMDAAPDATFYDVPLIPLRISDVTGFVGHALSAFIQLQVLIAFLRLLGIPPWNGPWVIVNAWSIFDRTTEHPLGDYTENPYHPLNVVVDEMVSDGIDFVFAAGNCGQFCPDRRCGDCDIGPGHSIYGANSHPRVITTGAVRTDTLWVGSSSQGPGQPLLSQWKPDLCAPSYFREVDDAFVGNLSEPYVGDTGSPFIASTGTSAACGLTAGIVAAIRSRWNQTAVTPDRLRDVLNQNARKTEGPNWNERLGYGIIDVIAALLALP